MLYMYTFLHREGVFFGLVLHIWALGHIFYSGKA
jgi:hypothetical protein